MSQPATLPPEGLPGLSRTWSRLVSAADGRGRSRTWHVLDRAPPDPVGTLLCVHGNPTWSYLWRDLLASPPPGWRVVAVDQLGMGFSERPGGARRLAQRVDDLARLTQALDLGRHVVVVAHDWGGPVALGWALEHREVLGGIVLTNTAVHQPTGTAAPTLIRAARTPLVLPLVTRATPTFVRGTLALVGRPLPRAVRDAYLAPYRAPSRRRAIQDFVADIPLRDPHPSMAALRRIADGMPALADVPALLLWGARDPVFSDLHLADLRARLPRAAVHRVEGASHLVTEDVDLPAAVTRWLAARDDVGAVRSHRDTGGRRTDDAGGRPTDDAGGRPTDDAGDAPGTTARRPLLAALRDRADDDAVALAEPGGARISFAELGRRVERVAAGMAAAGVRPGDRIGMLVEPGIDLVTAVYATWRAGGIIVVADAGLGVRGITRALAGARPDHLVVGRRGAVAARVLGWPGRSIAATRVGPPLRAALRIHTSLPELAVRGASVPAPAVPAADADAAVLFTSGSTGPAKGVVYTHSRLEAQRDALAAAYDLGPQDRLVAAFAPFALYAPALGITALVPDVDVTAPGTLTATALARGVAEIDATVVFGSPAALTNVVATADRLGPAEARALTGVRLVLSAGAPVPRALLARVARLAPSAEVHTPYGMTEVLPVADADLPTLDAAADRPAGSGRGVCVGRALPEVRLAIAPLDDQGRAAAEPTTAAETVGEICVDAPHGKDRYDRRWLTERATRTADGWHRTGDVGRLDRTGRLWLEGRLGDVVTTAAGPLTPLPVEHAAQGAAGVVRAAAVGVGPRGTQQLVVVVETTDGTARGRPRPLAPPRIAAAVRGAVDRDVAAVLVVATLPTDLRHDAKLDRPRLRRWASRALAGQRVGAP